MRENPTNQDSTSVLPSVCVFSHFFYQAVEIVPVSIRTSWYKGSADNNGKCQVREKALSLKNSPYSKAHFGKKSPTTYLEVDIE